MRFYLCFSLLPQGKIKKIHTFYYSWHIHLKKNKCSVFNGFSNIFLLPRFLLGLASFICGTHTSLSELHCYCLCFLVWMLKRPSVTCSSLCIDFLCILLCTGPDAVVLSPCPTGYAIFVLIELPDIFYMEHGLPLGFFSENVTLSTLPLVLLICSCAINHPKS